MNKKIQDLAWQITVRRQSANVIFCERKLITLVGTKVIMTLFSHFFLQKNNFHIIFSVPQLMTTATNDKKQAVQAGVRLAISETAIYSSDSRQRARVMSNVSQLFSLWKF